MRTGFKGRLARRDDFTRRAAEVDLWTLNHGTAQVFSNQVAVNVSQTDQTVKFRSPTGRDDLSARKVDGQLPPTFSTSGGIVTLTLAPRQIAILEQAD